MANETKVTIPTYAEQKEETIAAQILTSKCSIQYNKMLKSR